MPGLSKNIPTILKELSSLKSPLQMPIRLLPASSRSFRPNIFSVVAVLATLYAFTCAGAFSQQQLSKRYPAGKNVRLELKNISGTVTVESWSRDEVKISATMESPKANVTPRQIGEGVVIDVMGDNRGRGDVGDVNFKIMVPVNSSVDIETRRGDITVSNIRSGLVRAHISSEGDITLSGISATQVLAQNMIGNIFFDGEFSRGGTYQFQSTKGDISIRIPADSAFRLVAASPTKKITLGGFWNNGFKTLGDGRKFVGDVGDGRSSVMVTNLQGGITFMRR
jgi:putative adhesin